MKDNGPPERGDEALERELRELGRQLDHPPTPDLATSVRQRLERETTRRTPLPFWAVAAALLAVFLVVPALSFAVFQPSGEGGSSGAGGGQAAGGGREAAPEEPGVMSEAPTEDASGSASEDGDVPTSAAGTAAPLGGDLGLGERISLKTAEDRMGNVLLPALAGRPNEVYVTEGPAGEGVVLVYGDRRDFERGSAPTGFVLTELPGGVEDAFGGDPRAERVAVGEGSGIWLANHEAPGAQGYRLTEGLGGSALLFERGDVALRLESNFSQEEAIQLAESVR